MLCKKMTHFAYTIELGVNYHMLHTRLALRIWSDKAISHRSIHSVWSDKKLNGHHLKTYFFFALLQILNSLNVLIYTKTSHMK